MPTVDRLSSGRSFPPIPTGPAGAGLPHDPPAPGFDFDASGMSAVYAAARGLAPDALEIWRREIAGLVAATGRRVTAGLDAGCGTGRFSALLAETFDIPILGFDPSPGMLGQARRAVSDPRCAFAAGSLEAIPAPEGTADLAFLSMVIHHVRDWNAVFAELRRVLLPGSLVVVRTAVRESLPRLRWARFFPGALALDLKRLPSRAEIVTRFATGGFAPSGRRAVTNIVAADAPAYLARIRLRGLSGLRLIGDAEFSAGLSALESHLRESPTSPADFTETMDLFSFTRDRPRSRL